MKKKIGSVLGWISIFLVSAFFLFAAVMKFMPATPEGVAMQQQLGVLGLEYGLGIMQFVVLALYLIPRTSTVGTVLMVGYLGGALATNITHGMSPTDPFIAPMYVLFLLLMVGAWFRTPELKARLMGEKI